MAACVRLTGRVVPSHGHSRPTLRRRMTVSASASDAQRAYKKAAANKFVDTFVTNDQILGLGSGELSSLCIEEIGRRVLAGQLTGIRGVPSTDASASEAAFHGLPLHPKSSEAVVDLAFDQVDQLDVEASACILGVSSEPQQPQLYRALAMAQARAIKLVLLVESSQVVPRLGGTLPVLIEEETWEETAEEIDDLVLGDAEVWRRAAPGSANPNPRGGDQPYVTEDNHNILDLRYEDALKLFGEPEAYHKIENAILDIEGVVATGLLLGAAAAAVVADPQGPRVVELVEDLTLAKRMVMQDNQA